VDVVYLIFSLTLLQNQQEMLMCQVAESRGKFKMIVYRCIIVSFAFCLSFFASAVAPTGKFVCILLAAMLFQFFFLTH
jgi:hypothetical protein